MRIYSNLLEAYHEIKRDLVEMGVQVKIETYQDKVVKDDPEFETKELIGYTYSITSNLTLDEDFRKLGGNKGYVLAELSDRISPEWRNPGNSWTHRREIWEQFLHGGCFSYSYNERIRTQLGKIIHELKIHPHSRQGIITLFDTHQDLNNIGGKARIPCSMHYQFLIRRRREKNLLDIIYVMRSCDLYTHFIYDVYLAMRLQEFVANSLGLVSGHFTHFIGSLHCYKKDYEKDGVF